MESLIQFFQDYPIARICLDAYLALLVVSLLVFLAVKIKKIFILIFVGIFIGLISWFAGEVGLIISKYLYAAFFASYLLICVVLTAPELRKLMDTNRKIDTRADMLVSSTEATREAIVEAVFHMSSTKVGALITIEQHNSLDQYAERAIQLNSDISKELLEQIFIKDSPLHDGGVIIRGNKIVCAGAYYVLTQDETLDKTVGSRHRAGVGVSEITDSLTIIVSEETGAVHVATAGCMVAIDNKASLLEYINLFLGR
ncbi:MAG: diadenylate cyclase [Anaeroplasmataceae bacterium]|nr:diadenylate cyclase [Anaeroplasmataceae bacterium]